MVGRRRNQAHAGGGMPCLRNPGIHLFGRKMSALPRLCPLCHLNLNLTGTDQIAACNTETSRCHLFDCRAAILRTSGGVQTLVALSALPGIGFSVKMVHSDSQRLMGFLRNGSIGHGTRLKSLYNLFYRLHLFQWNGIFRIAEVHHASQVAALLPIHLAGVLLEQFIVSRPCGLLQKMNRLRIIAVFFPTASSLMLPQAV